MALLRPDIDAPTDRLLARVVSLNNAIAVTAATWLAIAGIAYRQQIAHVSPNQVDIGAMRFVGGGTPSLAAQRVVYRGGAITGGTITPSN